MNPELEALYEDWQKHAFAVGVYGCRPTADQISTACRPLRRGVD